MRKTKLLSRSLICILIVGMFSCSSNQNVILIGDASGALGKTKAPVSVEIKLNKHQAIAAEEGRLGLLDTSIDNEPANSIPAQLESTGEGAIAQLVVNMPDGKPGDRRFKLIESESPFNAIMKATPDPTTGQVIISEEGKNVLQYNYQTVYEKDVIRLENEKLEVSNEKLFVF